MENPLKVDMSKNQEALENSELRNRVSVNILAVDSEGEVQSMQLIREISDDQILELANGVFGVWD